MQRTNLESIYCMNRDFIFEWVYEELLLRIVISIMFEFLIATYHFVAGKII
jgi:hypothetical protein